MEVREYLRILRLHWWMVVLVALVTVGLCLAFTYTTSQAVTHRATTRLFVTSATSNPEDVNGSGQLSSVRVLSYADLVSGDEFSRYLVERLDLSETPEQLAAQISASVVEGTVILNVNVTNPSADRARFLADAVARELAPFVTKLENPPGEAQARIVVTVIDRAKLTSTIGGPQPVRSLGLGLVLGSLLGFGLAVARESLRPENVEDA